MDRPASDELRLEELYADAARSFIAFARSIDDEDWSRPVPCTPAWSVRDVLSHVSGVPDDVLAGRVDGVGTPAWSAAQVERHGAAGVAELLDRWSEQIEPFAALVRETGATRATIDCHCHEHDVRHALDLPGNRGSAVVHVAAPQFVGGLDVPFPVEVEMDGHVVDNGHAELGRYPHEEVVLRAVSSFEVFRSRLGRRSRRQVEDYAWSGPEARVAQVVDVWFVFGPSRISIHE